MQFKLYNPNLIQFLFNLYEICVSVLPKAYYYLQF